MSKRYTIVKRSPRTARCAHCRAVKARDSLYRIPSAVGTRVLVCYRDLPAHGGLS